MVHLLSRLFSWDFIRMGKVIEARYARCAPFWEPHLSCTRSFIDEHIQPGGRLAILGAGRLLDVDLKKLIPLFSEIHLFDADPTVVRTWRKASGVAFRERVIPRILDVTGSLSTWSSGLRAAVRHHNLAGYLDMVQPGHGTWEHERFDGVISLNLVGQIPIYWQDRVIAAAGSLAAEEERALLGSMSRLQAAHVKAVREQPRSWSILITDTEYYTYNVDHVEWDVEPALHGEALSELSMTSTRMVKQGESCWLWHLVPQFIESDHEGHIHRVEASAWKVTDPTDSRL